MQRKRFLAVAVPSLILITISMGAGTATPATRTLKQLREVLRTGSFADRQGAALKLAQSTHISLADKTQALVEALADEVSHPISRDLTAYAPQTEVLRRHYCHLILKKIGPTSVPQLRRLTPRYPAPVRQRLLAVRARLGDDESLPALLGALQEITDPWDRAYIAATFSERAYAPAAAAMLQMLQEPGWSLGRTDVTVPGRDPRFFPTGYAVGLLTKLGQKLARENGTYYDVGDPHNPKPLFPSSPERSISLSVMLGGEPLRDSSGQLVSVSALWVEGQHLLLPASFLKRVGVEIAPRGEGISITCRGRGRVWTPEKGQRGRWGLLSFAEPAARHVGDDLYIPVTALHPLAFGAVEWEGVNNRLWLWR